MRIALGRKAPQNLGFFCNISATAEVSNFKIGTQLGFAHHKILTIRKSGRGLRLEISTKFMVSYNISATAIASDFKIGMLLGFSNAHHKITSRGKIGPGPELEKLPKF